MENEHGIIWKAGSYVRHPNYGKKQIRNKYDQADAMWQLAVGGQKR